MTVTALLHLLAGCTGTPSEGTLSQNVGDAFAPCSEAEIRFMAQKHNFMPAFRPCGNNHFQDFAWSPDGRKLYFQLGSGHSIMDAEAPTKDTRVVPTPSPVGPGAWLSPTRLAVPVSPGVDAQKGAGPQLAVYDTEQASVFSVPLPADWAQIDDVQSAGDGATVLLTAVSGTGATASRATEISGPRRAFRVTVADGTWEPAFPWLTGNVDSLTLTPEQGLVAVGRGDVVTLHEAATGAVRGRWSPASRGAVHPQGRWMMLEHEGSPISLFYQRSWDELSEKAREREKVRAQQFSDRLPDSFETETRPPTLSFVDLPTGRRWRIDSVFGRDFDWYAPTPFYGSFVLWGFEGKQYKRNVLLGDFTSRMTTAAANSTFIGVVPFGPDEGARYEPPDPTPK